MGNKQNKEQGIIRPSDEESAIKRNSFEFVYVIGKGGFGKVKIICSY